MGNAPRPVNSTNVISLQMPSSKQIHTTSVSVVPDTDLEVHVHRNSFKLTECPDGHFLTFKFDSLDICVITIYYFGVEVLNKLEDHTLYFANNTEKYPSPGSYKFGKGLNCSFPDMISKISLSSYHNELTAMESHNQYHIIIIIKPEPNNFPYESTFLKIEKNKEGWKPVLIRQKIHFEESSFYLNEIYGLSEINDENVCVVCLNGKSSVTLMPCKHLCLCHECATILAQAVTKKCPICRAGKGYLGVQELIFIQN
jgi:hypothetical protein